MKNQKKLVHKRCMILDTMEQLLSRPDAENVSIAQIAKEAGIGKGSIYYYFKSREEIINALIQRVYSDSISRCREVLEIHTLNALQKIEKMMGIYVQNLVTEKMSVIQYTYKEENAVIRQKVRSENISSLSPILTKMIYQGIKENLFHCNYPDEIAEYFIYLMEPCFSYFLFRSNTDKNINEAKALESIFESSLKAPSGSFGFLHKILIKFFK